MTFCEACNVHLDNKSICQHLARAHNVHVRRFSEGESQHLLYCIDCDKFLGNQATCVNASQMGKRILASGAETDSSST